jgi:hypothetical protein
MDTTRGVACLLVAVICLSCAAAAAARSPAARLHRHLKRFNKPAVKSIEVGQVWFVSFFTPELCQACCFAVALCRFELLAWGKKSFPHQVNFQGN